MEIGNKLKDARVNCRLTQEEAAEQLFVSRQTLSNWETGKTLPDIANVLRLSDLYQISLDELLKGDQKMREKVEKDTNRLESNRRLILIVGVAVLVAAIVRFIGIFISNTFFDFCNAAMLWVLMGIGVACAMVYISGNENK